MNKTKSPRRINTCSYKVAIGKLHRAVELNEMCCPSFSSFLIEMTSKNLRNCGLLPNLRWHRGRLKGRTRQRELQSHIRRSYMYRLALTSARSQKKVRTNQAGFEGTIVKNRNFADQLLRKRMMLNHQAKRQLIRPLTM